MEPYAESYKLAYKQRDYEAWLNGQYLMSAFGTVISNAFGGKKQAKKAEYIDTPITHKIEEQIEPLSEEEIQRRRELFVLKLQTKKENFERNHRGINNERGNNTRSN